MARESLSMNVEAWQQIARTVEMTLELVALCDNALKDIQLLHDGLQWVLARGLRRLALLLRYLG